MSCTKSRDLKSPTPMGEHFSTNFSSWDLAVPGSPSISKLMSPRRVSPSGSLEQQGAKIQRPGEPLFQYQHTATSRETLVALPEDCARALCPE